MRSFYTFPASDHTTNTHVVIRFEGVSKAFSGKRILNNITCDIFQGEIFVVMGMSGCGKSTLLRHIIGTIRPDEGIVYVLGKNIQSLSSKQREYIRQQCGMVFQSGALFDSLSVFGNISLPLVEHTNYDQELIRIMVREKLKLVGLEGYEDFMPNELSGGMRKRVALARAIIMDPKIILYDEPTTGLDPIGVGVINKLIVDLSKKLSVTSIVVTHDMQSILKIADRVAMLHDGQLIRVDEPGGLKASNNPLIKQFLYGEPEGPVEFYKRRTYEFAHPQREE